MKIEAETGTLADAVMAASRIAGKDHLAGVLVTVGEYLEMQSTDLEVTYRRRIPTLVKEFDDQDARQWYLPAKIVATFLSRLPLGEDSTVEVEDFKGQVRVRCHRTTAKFNLLDASKFPGVEWWPDTFLSESDTFAKKLNQVAFACSDREGALHGIYADGEHLWATDANQLARVDCKIPLRAPLVLPLRPVAAILRQTDLIQCGELESSHRFVVQTDVDTQFSTTTIVEQYPNVSQLTDLTAKTDVWVEFSSNSLQEAVGRMLSLCGQDHYPRLWLRFQPDRILMQMIVEEYGSITDEVPSASKELEQPVTYCMNPRYLMDGLKASNSAACELHLHSTNTSSPLWFDDGKGFFFLFMPFAKGSS